MVFIECLPNDMYNNVKMLKCYGIHKIALLKHFLMHLLGTVGTHNTEYVSYVGAVIALLRQIYGADFHADRQLAQFSNLNDNLT